MLPWRKTPVVLQSLIAGRGMGPGDMVWAKSEPRTGHEHRQHVFFALKTGSAATPERSASPSEPTR